MDGLLIFDQQNDIVFTKLNAAAKRKLFDLAKEQQLISDDAVLDDTIDTSVLVQFFSPIIASQRIMFCQFDNSYTSLQCEDNLNIAFEEFLGFLFLKIGNASVEDLQKYLGICIAFIKHICGPDISQLKVNAEKSVLLDQLLSTWSETYKHDETLLVEAIEFMLVSSDLKKATHRALESACDSLKQDLSTRRLHGLLFINNKLLSICSSRQAQELTPADLIFLQLYTQIIRKSSSAGENAHKNLIFLQGNPNSQFSGCIPHIVHLTYLNEDVELMFLIEHGSLAVASGLFDVFFAVHKLRILQMQNDIDNLRPPFENLDHYVKHTLDAFKKTKYNAKVDAVVKGLTSRWELLRRKYLEYLKNNEKSLVLVIESNIPIFIDALKDVFRLTCIECNIPNVSLDSIPDRSNLVENKLLEIADVLRAKPGQNIMLKSVFKDINGLVHFIHVNRTTGRVLIPVIDVSAKNGVIIKQQLWEMVKSAQSYLHDGHLTLVWQDTAFYYSYFLWFEDSNGTQLKPKEMPNSSSTSATVTKPHIIPGILTGDFYQNLIERCFPKTSNKVRCYELFTIYIGLTSTHSLLDFNRRLVAILRDNVPAFYGADEAY